MNSLRELEQQGQSIWLDFITRQFVTDGHLKKLIDNDGLKGVTSNPTIFQKAFSSGKEYDAPISQLQAQGQSADRIFESIAIQDIQQACDLFRPVYDKTQAGDGFVSLEVNPHLARNTQGTLAEARKLFDAVKRPNVMIKIPGTKECLKAIEQAIGEGININITLIFSLERYQEVMNAWLSGLEILSKASSMPAGRQGLKTIGSVASFFVSRVDSLVDSMLEKANHPELMGKAAIANARLAYQMFEKMKASPRFKALQDSGAHIQRPLWASTSTKNPNYRDVLYIEELVGQETVNTIPLPTIDAFRDHGQVKVTLPGDPAKATQDIEKLKQAGVSMDQVTKKLEDDGLKLFEESYDSLLKSLDEKKEALKVAAKK
jgi:transaldolase